MWYGFFDRFVVLWWIQTAYEDAKRCIEFVSFSYNKKLLTLGYKVKTYF